MRLNAAACAFSDPDAREAVNRALAPWLRLLVANKKISYAITTGVGKLKRCVGIVGDQVRELQINLVGSHAVGVGEPLSISEERCHDALGRSFAVEVQLGRGRAITIDRICGDDEFLSDADGAIARERGSERGSGSGWCTGCWP